MKKWTVMLIPHDRTSTRTLTLSSFHFWGALCLVAVLVFGCTFLFQRERALQVRAERLQYQYRQLELEKAKTQVVQQQAPVQQDDQHLREVEARLRAEYEASIAAITSELGELYDMEAKARSITGLAPREKKAVNTPVPDGGKGGPSVLAGAFIPGSIDVTTRPDHVIYGLSRPSADLILQEIQMRTQSFSSLIRDMEVQQDRIARVPSGWPIVGGLGRISSSFGYRRDPFTRRVRHHNGVDIAARYGSKVRATAKGVVISSTYEADYGNIVRIDHGNGLTTCYAHLAKRKVNKGDVVERQTVVGTLGSTGRSTGPHLHYEVHVNKKTVNPAKYLAN